MPALRFLEAWIWGGGGRTGSKCHQRLKNIAKKLPKRDSSVRFLHFKRRIHPSPRDDMEIGIFPIKNLRFG
jgi:hypothetical protein